MSEHQTPQQPNMTRAQAAKADLFFWLQALVIALVVLILLFTFVGRIITVDGSSMLPTLHHKDVLLLRTVAYTPEQGDVVVLTKDFSGYTNQPIVKRVIAVEGDTVDISDDGYMVVNGEELYEPYAKEAIRDSERGTQQYPLTVLEDHVFAVGDNRNGSTDSRWVEVGQIEEARVIGKALFRIWPLNRIGGLS